MSERPIADYALSDTNSAAPARTELLHRVWGWSVGDESTVTVHVRRLREKVESEPTAPRLIRTVWGVGYRLDPST
jgi:two-component system response regulator ResD